MAHYYETEIEGLPVRVSVPFSGGTYMVKVIGSGGGPEGKLPDELTVPEFRSLEAAEKAIKAYNLSLRKGFKNPIAWTRRGEQLEVTSICEDGRSCWVKRASGSREKMGMAGLYSSAEAVSKAVIRESELRKEIEQAWEEVGSWKPEW